MVLATKAHKQVPYVIFWGQLVLVLLLMLICILYNHFFLINTDFDSPSTYIEYFLYVKNYGVCYIRTL